MTSKHGEARGARVFEDSISGVALICGKDPGLGSAQSLATARALFVRLRWMVAWFKSHFQAHIRTAKREVEFLVLHLNRR